MNFDQFIRDILRYDMEQSEVDCNKKENIWNHITEGISQNETNKSDALEFP